MTKADNLLEQIGYYEAEARRFKDDAEAQGDINLALKAVDRALRCVEIYAKVKGLIPEGQQVNILINNPEWLALRTKIVLVLENFPEAKAALVRALDGS